ncbi:hypothetical protein [Kangiella sp. M94]
MELQEAYNLKGWADEEIVNREVVQKYSALQQALQQNAQRAQNQPPIPFNDQKKALLETLNSVNIFGLSNPQLMVLEKLNILQHVGSEPSQEIKALMIEHASDLAYLAEEIKKYQTELQQGVNQLNSIYTSLTPIVSDEELILSKDEILTRVTFDNEASIHDVKELRNWINRLYNITRGLSVACNKPFEDIKVEGASRGSFIIDLIVGRYIASVLTKTLKEIFQCMTEYQTFKLKAHEAELAALKKDKFEQDYLEDKERWESRMERLKEQVIEDLSDHIKKEVDNYNDANDGELRKSVKDLVELITKGGDIDPVIPPIDTSDDEDEEGEQEGKGEAEVVSLADLREDYVKLTELKHDIKLEHLTDFMPDDGEENNDE